MVLNLIHVDVTIWIVCQPVSFHMVDLSEQAAIEIEQGDSGTGD
jgi:ABC-type cobalamin transport system permease subunit